MNLQRHIPKICFLMIAASQMAISQQETGTIVVMRVTPDHAVIAADSMTNRTCHPSGKHMIAYDVCKVMAFDNQYLFAASGYTANYIACDPHKTLWNVRDITVSLYKGGVKNASDFATRWGQQMMAVLQKDAKIGPPPQHNGIVLGGFFVGSSNGKLVAYDVIISADQKGKLDANIGSAVTDGENDLMGFTEIIEEFQNNRTDRAHLWHQKIDKLSNDEQVIALAQLVKHLDINKRVGGDIDAVRMTPFGIDWIQRKKSCQDYEHSRH